MENAVGLRDLRENTDKYIKKVSRGESFLVFKHLKPIFKITPPQEENWETIIDFTKIKKGGVQIEDVLARL